MKIDIEPITEKAVGMDKIAMEARGIDSLFVIKRANGECHSIKFDEKGLREFLPKRTVSEMLKSYEDGIKRRIETCKKAIKTKKHPTWTEPFYDENGKCIGRAPYRLTDVSCFEKELDRLNSQSGKMTFVKIIL